MKCISVLMVLEEMGYIIHQQIMKKVFTATVHITNKLRSKFIIIFYLEFQCLILITVNNKALIFGPWRGFSSFMRSDFFARPILEIRYLNVSFASKSCFCSLSFVISVS